MSRLTPSFTADYLTQAIGNSGPTSPERLIPLSYGLQWLFGCRALRRRSGSMGRRPFDRTRDLGWATQQLC